MLSGLVLHVLHKVKDGERASLASMDACLENNTKGVLGLWQEMPATRFIDCPKIIAASSQDMVDRPEEEAGSIWSMTNSYLSLFRYPIIAENTSRLDFKVSDLMQNDKPLSLYINCQPNDNSRLRPLIRILINTILRKSCGKLVFKDGKAQANYRHRLLLL